MCIHYNRNVFVFQEQYIFIHDAILESVTCGDTEISSANLRLVLKKMIKNNPQDSANQLQMQFKVTTCTFVSLLTISHHEGAGASFS